MKLSASFLSIKEEIKENIKKLDNSNIDYLHLDIMDNIFVPNKTWTITEISDLLKDTTKPKDVHLMVKDVISYVDNYSKLNPEFITFHLEAVDDVKEVINYIKSKNTKVGISIKPKTDVKEILAYLNDVDLVLVMSVEPGFGGQKFLSQSIDKVEELNKLRLINNYNYLIEIDGGINLETINNCKNANVDIVVVGSYITNNENYDEQINSLNLK